MSVWYVSSQETLRTCLARYETFGNVLKMKELRQQRPQLE